MICVIDEDDGQVIYKPHPCAFTNTPLDAHLKQLEKTKIVLVGEFDLFFSRAIHSIPCTQ